MNRIRRAWHHTLQHLGLWQPATPHIRTWDKDFNYIATLQQGTPARYAPRTYHKTCDTQRKREALGNARIIVTVDFDFDKAGHDKLRAAHEHIATIATPQPNNDNV